MKIGFRKTLTILGRSYCQRIGRSVALFATAIIFGALWPTQCALAAPQVIPGQVPRAAAELTPIGSLSATNWLRLAISLPLRNQSALSNLLSQLYDPNSPNYRRFLTPQQFTAKFCPAEQDYQSVINFATTNSLYVVGTYSNRMLLDVIGTVPNVEKAFHIRLLDYQHPVEHRTFLCPRC